MSICTTSRWWLVALVWGLWVGVGPGPSALRAQSAPLPCLLLPLSPAERVQAASLVVEAEVLDAVGEWDAAHQHIFTRQRLRVFRVLKGALPDTAALPLLVEGGQVGLARQELTNTLHPLPVGQQGLFFLMPAPWVAVGGGPAFAAYASSQGVILYDVARGTAAEPARTYASWAAARQQTEQLSGQPAQQLRPNWRLLAAAPRALGAKASSPNSTLQTLAPAIVSFSPALATAGTGVVLTIRGSGFGSSRGSGGVDFRNADDGGATTTRALDRDYLSWSDTQVQVHIPSLASGGHPAGTGPVSVVTSDGTTATTATSVTILYALSNIDNAAGTLADRPSHIATNATGGLTFHISPNFRSNAAATAAWQRGLAQWRCSTGINWELGSDAAANTIASDNSNVIAFDDGNTLPARVLGRTTSYYQGCYDPTGNVVFYVAEIDQLFTSALPFQFGPALALGGQYDFESVAVHELGHAQQLTHLIRPRAIMHYGIAAGTNLRVLDPASDVAGGRLVLRTRSFRNRGCGGPGLLPAPLSGLAAGVGPTPLLTFSTRDECFVSSFVLERSAGIDTTAAAAGWQAVATIAAGQATGQYTLTDPQPPGGLRYYRLGVRRPDGSTDYAAPLAMSAEAVAAGAQVFPNPVVGDAVQLTYSAAVAGNLVLRFYDELGRYHRGQRVAVQAGLNVLTLSMAGMAPGFYILRFTAADQSSRSVRLVRL
ncbi:T9SS type A sorting domain-containing protein [Hymenobacter sp. HMF4947]|uniref:T9SS type A sorting domain-containing protein n=1 Tax=Hymenobacter ginkgonis TaxID=2682976 RepID=A0A7K1TDT4_9BACT|nr:T9SS type A sorting domain-containing protein [Hymenobacter ginkgonis]MVN76321.1 T9SS type A sorting domain-containing protein [Hymenobacter ginkgonis]